MLQLPQPSADDGAGFDREDTKVLFEVLFDLRFLLARLVEFVEGGGDDGEEEEEEEEEEDPDLP